MRKSLVLLIILLFATSSYTVNAESFRVTGKSMLPTLKEGDIVNVDKTSEYKDGDVVIAELKNGKKVVKRLKGNILKGDNSKGSIDIPLTEVKSIIGKPMENTDVLTDDDIKAFEEVFASGIKDIQTAYQTSGVLTESGDLFIWGYNGLGTVGDSTTVNKIKPVKVLSNIDNFDMAYYNVVAVTTNGDLYSWGYNVQHQILATTADAVTTPTFIMADVKMAVTGLYTLALKKNGEVFSWGYNNDYQLGLGTTGQLSVSNKQRVILPKIKSIYSSTATSAAITESGDLYMWGNNFSSQIGNGETTVVKKPEKIMSNAKKAYLSPNFSMAITTSNDLYTWGLNTIGQLGNGTDSRVSRPEKIMSDVLTATVGEDFAGAVKLDGDLYMWGGNANSRLGDGLTETRLSPYKILSNMKKIDSYSDYTLAVSETGELISWGTNAAGQLGDGMTTAKRVPVAADMSLFFSTYNLTKQISSVIYLPDDAPPLVDYNLIGTKETGEILTRTVNGYSVVLNIIRYTPPTTIGNLNIN